MARDRWQWLAVLLGAATMAGVLALLVWDAAPRWFPARAHDALGALPLALIAAAYLAFQAARRPGLGDAVKAVLLAAAFLFWAANQYWPDAPRATLWNDIAIALFVLDVFLVIAAGPRGAQTPAGEPAARGDRLIEQ